MSEEALPFLRVTGLAGRARAIHLAFSHWTLVLVSAHLGLHFERMFRAPGKSRRLRNILPAAAAACAGYGLLLSVRAGIYSYMTFRVQFAFLDYEKAPAQILLENVLMMLSWAFIACELNEIVKKPAADDPHAGARAVGMLALEFVTALVLSLIVN